MELLFGKCRVPRLYFFVRLGVQRVEHIVGVDIDALPAGHVHELPVADVDPKGLCGVRAQGHRFVPEVEVFPAACAYLWEHLRYYPLEPGLARIDYRYHTLAPVELFVSSMAAAKDSGIEHRAVLLFHKLAIRERVVHKPELPRGVGDVLCDVGSGAVAPD